MKRLTITIAMLVAAAVAAPAADASSRQLMIMQDDAQVRATARFKSCAQKEDQADERTRNNKARVQATATTFTDPAFHITSFYREIAKRPDKNGRLVNVGTFDRYTYQRGRVLVVLAIDMRAATKTRIRSLNAEVTAAYDAAVRALEARVPSS